MNLPNEIYAVIFELVEPTELPKIANSCENFYNLLLDNKWRKFSNRFTFSIQNIQYSDYDIGKYILRGDKCRIRTLIPCVLTKSIDLVKYAADGFDGKLNEYANVVNGRGITYEDEKTKEFIINESLRLSAITGCLDIVKYLINIGADISYTREDNVESDDEDEDEDDDADVEDFYIVTLAARNRHLDVVKYLVSLGANIYEGDGGILEIGVRNGDFELVKYIVGLGGEYDYHAYIPVAAEFGNLEMVKLVVSFAERFNASVSNDDYEYTSYNEALYKATRRGYLEIIEYLMLIGARLNVEDLYIILNRDPNLMRFIISLDDNILKFNGSKLMGMAVENNKIKVVKYLLSAGVTVDVSICQKAAKSSDLAIFNHLTSVGALSAESAKTILQELINEKTSSKKGGLKKL